MQQQLLDISLIESYFLTSIAPIKEIKHALQKAHTLLAQRFNNKEEETAILIHERSQMMDALLSLLWSKIVRADEFACLIAVGGYGRGELHPYSDIDLFILLDEQDERIHTPSFEERLQHFITFLWDIKLEVGQSVRTLTECKEQAQKDITIITNLIEAHFICGKSHLYQQLLDTIAPEHIWNSHQFFNAKVEEQKKRYNKFNDSACNLEPNIKEAPGGLRDIQLIQWLTRRHFMTPSLHSLIQYGFLTQVEYEELEKGKQFLWKIRFALHILNKRYEDRLLFEHQRTIAKQFGYQDESGKLAVELFMKDYYNTVMQLERLNEMLLQLFQETILDSEPLNSRFRLYKGYISVIDESIFRKYPSALLEIFILLAQHPEIKGIRAQTIRLIRNHCYLIDSTFRQDTHNQQLFMALLKQPRGVTHQLRKMNRYGVLAAYLPDFATIVGQMQHDLFHVYTVDEHILRVIRNVRRFSVDALSHEFPLCSQIFKQLKKPELLYIAALYHDIAKGRGGDHSTLGAIDAERFCRQHHLNNYDTKLVAWLVSSHLMMSSTAQRKDINDPEEIQNFANNVGDQQHLDYLYLLTVADIRATSPKVWNSWKDALLKQLYQQTQYFLRRGLHPLLSQTDRIQARKDDVRQQLLKKGYTLEQVENLYQRLNDHYFLRYHCDEIIWHGQQLIKNSKESPLILTRQNSLHGGLEVFIHTKKIPHLFVILSSIFEQANFNITEAKVLGAIHKCTFDTYTLFQEDGHPVIDTHRITSLRTMISKSLQDPDPEIKINKRLARQNKHFQYHSRIYYEIDTHKDFTIIEVITSDRPGLLSLISRVLLKNNIQLINAKISTFGEKVEDIFYITDQNNNAIDDTTVLETLKQCLIYALDKDKTEPIEPSLPC